MNQKLPAPVADKALTSSRLVVPAGILLAAGVLGAVLTNFTIFSILVAGVGALLFFTRAIVRKSLEASSGPQDQPLSEQLKLLKHEVAQTKYLKHQNSLGEKAAAQTDLLETSYKFLLKILTQKFNPSEITFSRYEEAINEAVFKIAENLKHSAHLITLLDHQAPPSETSLSEVSTLLGLNAEALKNLDQLAESLNGINRGDHLKQDFEETLEKLRTLAHRAQAYSTKNKE